MNTEYLTSLDTRTIDDDTVKLIVDFTYASKLLNRIITVPAGFVTDFASVPRLPFAYLVAGGRGKMASVIHDYFYQTHTCRDRKSADRVFLEAMKESGVGIFPRGTMYSAVRLAGFSAWNSGPSRYKTLQRLLLPVIETDQPVVKETQTVEETQDPQGPARKDK